MDQELAPISTCPGGRVPLVVPTPLTHIPRSKLREIRREYELGGPQSGPRKGLGTRESIGRQSVRRKTGRANHISPISAL